MTKPLIHINGETREMTADEYADYQKLRSNVAAEAAAADAIASARASARTKLAALGLTEAEVAALLGA